MKTSPNWEFASGPAPERWRKTRRLARAGTFLALLDALVIIAAPLSRLYLDIPGILAFRVFFYALLAGAVLAGAGLLLSIFAAIARIDAALRHGLMMMIPGVIAATTVLAWIGPERIGSPMIHDISTDTADPPVFIEAEKRRSPGENSIEYGGEGTAVLQRRTYPGVKPILSSLSRDEALQETTQTVKDLGWEFLNVDYDRGIIEACDTTRIFGFVDDVVIRVRREGSGSRIDIRSASRVGKGDLGKNAERIERFTRTFRG